MEVPVGVRIRDLVSHADARGSVEELFREEWGIGARPVQWDLMHSRAGVLRGMHVHSRRADYVVLFRGLMTLGLRDLRRGSPTEGLPATLELDGKAPVAVAIPPGVAHGFHFREDSSLVFSLSHAWEVKDEFGCIWNDPELGFDWRAEAPLLSPRDSQAPSLRVLLEMLEPLQPLGGA